METYNSREVRCVQECMNDGLLTAIAGAQPSGIGKKLTQRGFKMMRSLDDKALNNNDLAEIIVQSVLKHIERSPEGIKIFIDTLDKSGYSGCETFARRMSIYMGRRKMSLPSSIPRPVVRLGSEPPASQRQIRDPGTLARRRVVSESSNETSVNQGASSTSGAHLSSGGSALKQPHTQSTNGGPCTKSGSESSVDQRSLSTSSANHPKPSQDKRRTKSTGTHQGTCAKSTSGPHCISGKRRKHVTHDGMQVDGEEKTGGRQVIPMMDRIRTSTPEKKQHRRYSYDMNRDGKHGIALIMNNIEWQQDKEGKPLMSTRDGAKEDAECLRSSLQAIGYNVILSENLTGDGMKEELTSVRDMNINEGDDSFICCILSHGGSYGIFGIDRKCIPVNQFSEILEPDKCPQLKHKPKIFFIQACRGREVSMPIDGSGDSDKMMPYVPRGADFYFSYATYPGHVALRSHYPQLLSQALLEHSAELSIDEIVTEIHDKLARKIVIVETLNEQTSKYERKEHLQIGQVVHTMRRAVYFK